jgi:hypothetical protein
MHKALPKSPVLYARTSGNRPCNGIFVLFYLLGQREASNKPPDNPSVSKMAFSISAGGISYT